MQPSSHDKSFLPFAVVIVLGLFVACFHEIIFQDRLFAFRDAAYFYYPLFEWIQQTWEAGRLPWWNPYENGGVPVGANPAASLFYPGKLIFFAVRDFDTAYGMYILSHVLLATFWAYRLARHWHASRPAATLASIAYTFSGAVLIQYSNVIFLVGAAWLPAGVLAADRMFRYRRKRDAILLGMVCALLTLGGDPQAAYHLGLLALLLMVLRALRRRRLAAGVTPTFSTHRKLSSAVTSLAAKKTKTRLWKLVGISLAVGLGLAAVQIVPTIAYLVKTDRGSDQLARSFFEVPGMIGKEVAQQRIVEGLLCQRLDRPGHQSSVYEFSIGPWRFAEMVWPNCYGQQFPLHRRWIQALPGEGRVWTPTLYAGILPLGFALGAFRLRRRTRRSRRSSATARSSFGSDTISRRWMSWTLLLGLLGSLGYYGLVWLVEELVGPISVAGPPVGGLYWLMTVVLPGYVYFRYPAKLLVLVALGLAMLAARGWDDFFSSRRTVRTDRIFFGVMATSLVALVGFVLVKPFWSDWVSNTPACPIFGPLDKAGAFGDTFFGLLQASVVSGMAWFSLHFAIPNAKYSERKEMLAPILLIFLAALDVGLANRWIIATAPAELWRTKAPVPVKGGSILQIYRWPNFHDPRWKEQGSTDRLAEEVRWNCQTLYPKCNLLQRVGVVNSYGTMMPTAHRELLRRPPVEVMRATGATIAILPRTMTLPEGRRIPVDEDAEFSVWRLRD